MLSFKSRLLLMPKVYTNSKQIIDILICKAFLILLIFFISCFNVINSKVDESLIADANNKAEKALQKFQDRQVAVAMPALLETIKVVPYDYVSLEYIGAAYSMAGRRFANLKYKSVKHANKIINDEKKALMQACFYFQKSLIAYDYRHNAKNNRNNKLLDKLLYPQIKYANDHEIILRAYGDAMNWLGKKEEAQKIFNRGVHLKLFPSSICRPINYLPTIKNYMKEDEAAKSDPIFFIDNDYFSYILDPIQQDLLPILKSIFSIKNLFSNSTNNYNNNRNRRNFYNHFPWKYESGGLSRGQFWYALTFVKNGVINKEVISKFPKLKHLLTNKWLEEHPSLIVKSGQIKLSLMLNGTHVRPHAGPSNNRLRMHCPLILPSIVKNIENDKEIGLHLRVGTSKKKWELGKCFIFNESCEHEVKLPKEMNMPRLILIVDFANILLKDKDMYTSKKTISVQYLKKETTKRSKYKIMQKLLNEYMSFHEAIKRVRIENKRRENKAL